MQYKNIRIWPHGFVWNDSAPSFFLALYIVKDLRAVFKGDYIGINFAPTLGALSINFFYRHETPLKNWPCSQCYKAVHLFYTIRLRKYIFKKTDGH
jgi:hypothetical protein